MQNKKIKSVLLIGVFTIAISFGVNTLCADGMINSSKTSSSTEITTDSNEASNVINYAMELLGKPDKWGEAGPDSFDNPGFTQYVFKNAAGIDIGRTTYEQIDKGREVLEGELQPGDLVFCNSDHVGIYIGNGQIIHAPRGNDVVKITKGYAFWRARRVL